MKKRMITVVALFVVTSTLTSCATVFGGKVSECQRTKPEAGKPTRPVRVAALICDIILFWPGAIVDFATGAIYKPCDKK